MPWPSPTNSATEPTSRALSNLGEIYNELGRHDHALACCERAVTIAQEIDDPFDHGAASVHLGRAYHGLGRHAEATEQLRRALDLNERFGIDEWQGMALMYLGDIEHDLGHVEAAVPRWQAAHHIFVQVSHVFARQTADRLARLT